MSLPPHETFEVVRRFLPREPLGEGAMGEVFGAVDAATGQPVAVKILRPELAVDPAFVARFRSESEITAAIDHRGGIPVYGLGTTADGRPFYVMKAVRGRTLRQLLDERGAQVHDLLWRRRLLDLFASICDTVAYAHSHGVVHRDLKPDNVLVDEQGAATVVDWGLAKRLDPDRSRGDGRTVLGDVLGTPGYMAPEQAEGAAIEAGAPADVFALGAILYEILSGRAPFAGATPREATLAAIHRDPPDPLPAGRWLGLAHSLSAVCRKALAKQAAQRYRNAGELAADLRALRRGRAATATRPSLAERLRWAARRRPMSFAALGSGLAVLALGALVYAAQLRIDHRMAERALARIERRDVQIDAASASLRELDRQLAVAAPAERRELRREHTQVGTRRLLQQLDGFYLLLGVDQLRFVRPDPRVVAAAKDRVFEALRSALDLGEPMLAKALAEALLERGGEQGAVVTSMSDAERTRLRALLDEADRTLRQEAAATR